MDTGMPGSYRITYKCYNGYCGRNTVYKTFTLTVNPKPETEQEEAENPDTEAENKNDTETEHGIEGAEFSNGA